jgi:hypothetical protein
MEAEKAHPEKLIPVRKWKPLERIDHASFGIGRVSESRGDKLDIDFVNGGSFLATKQFLRRTREGE